MGIEFILWEYKVVLKNSQFIIENDNLQYNNMEFFFKYIFKIE